MTKPALHLSDTRKKLIIFLILGMFPLLGMGIDLITPSLPAISQDLHVSHSISKSLVAIFLFAYSIGNFCAGFLSDTIGRQKLTLGGLAGFSVASLLPAIWPHTAVLLSARFLQGFCLASFGVVGRVVFSDILTKEKFMHVSTYTATMWGIGPIFGPMIGGYLQYYFNWQASFYFFAIYGFIGFLALLIVLPETHFDRQKLHIKQLKTNITTIVSTPLFIGLVLLMAVFYSVLIVFNTLGPFLIQNTLGHTSIYYGHLALVLGMTFLLGTMLCRKLMKHFQQNKISIVTILTCIFIVILMLLLAYFDNKNLDIVLIPSFLLFLSCGIVYPAALARAISLFPKIVGTTSAVMNLINIALTSITATVMGFINAQSTTPILLSYLSLLLIATTGYFVLIKQGYQRQ